MGKHDIETHYKQRHNEIFAMIQDQDNEVPVVKYEDMKQIGFFLTDHVDAEGVFSERIKLGLRDMLVFRVKIKAGAEIKAIKHDCKKRLFVRHGLIENLNTKKKLGTMQQDLIYPMSKNTIYGHTDSEFYITFEIPHE